MELDPSNPDFVLLQGRAEISVATIVGGAIRRSEFCAPELRDSEPFMQAWELCRTSLSADELEVPRSYLDGIVGVIETGRLPADMHTYSKEFAAEYRAAIPLPKPVTIQ